jgi:hypothetical protein
MKQNSKNIGGALLYSLILACLFMGLCAALYQTFFHTYGTAPAYARISLFAENLFLALFTLPFLGMLFASPGLALAYMLLTRRKSPPQLWLCFLCSTLIGSLVTLFWVPVWSVFDYVFAPFFIAGGPLTGLFYYFITSTMPPRT